MKTMQPVVASFFAGLLALVNSSGAVAGEASPSKIIIQAARARETINRNIYGQFSEHLGRCIYEGIWVGEASPIPNTRGIRNDVVAALKELKLPVLRWPGGCFADEYHWRDGIGPREQRPAMINTHWGGVVENNHFGTHEFLDLCDQLGCEAYICGNLGSGTVQEMQQWVEYVTFPGVSPMAGERKGNGREQPWKLRYFGVGNENWGCGGNMTAEFYADQYKRYSTYVRNFGTNRVFKIACGPNGADYKWTEVMMREAGRRMQGLALHYYCGSGKKTRSATRFDEEDWFFQLKNALRMEELVTKHVEIMQRYDPENRVALIVDEWGAWHAVEPGTNPGFLYQQNSLRDALVAGSTLNIFNNHCDRVKMANIAQTINVLQSMILTQKEKMVLTPTYHVFEMFKVHQDAKLLPIQAQSADYLFGGEKIPKVNGSASRDAAGSIHMTFCNLDPNTAAELTCELEGAKAEQVSGRVLTAPQITSHNTFDQSNTVAPKPFDDFKVTAKGLDIVLPPKCVVLLSIK